MQFRIRHTPTILVKTGDKTVMIARSVGAIGSSAPGNGIITENGIFFITEDNIFIVQEA
jgi:hypothetical protein